MNTAKEFSEKDIQDVWFDMPMGQRFPIASIISALRKKVASEMSREDVKRIKDISQTQGDPEWNAQVNESAGEFPDRDLRVAGVESRANQESIAIERDRKRAFDKSRASQPSSIRETSLSSNTDNSVNWISEASLPSLGQLTELQIEINTLEDTIVAMTMDQTRLKQKVGRLATRAAIAEEALTKMIDLHASGIAETSLLMEIAKDAFIELRHLSLCRK